MADSQSVVLLTIDSFRTDYCGFADGESGAMPTLDGLAEDGLVFENAIAPGAATFASATSFLTGMDTVERPASGRGAGEGTENPGGEGAEADDHGNTAMRDRIRGHMSARRSVAEQFAARGYETAAFTANPWTSRYFGFDEGFDHYEDFMEGAESDGFANGTDRGTVGTLASNATSWWRGQDMFMSWEALADDIAEWTAHAEEPYFLWIFLVDAHLPYLPPARHRSQSRLKTYPANLGLFLSRDLPFESRLHGVLTEAYENSLRYTDEFVSFLRAEIGEQGGDEADPPLLAIHGDHGEMFGEHGMYGHGRQLYDELVNVPLVVANGPQGRIEQPFSLRRLPALLDGLSRGEADTPERLTEPYVFASTRMPSATVRGRNWKYIWSPEEEELYDLTRGEGAQLDDEELREAGRDLVEWWRGSQAEKTRIVAAASDLAASESV